MPASNVFQSYAKGQQLGQQRELNELKRKQDFLTLDRNRQKALFDDARVVNSFLKSGQTEQALNMLSNRAGLVEQLGGDPSDTMEVSGYIARGDIDGAINLLDSVEKAGIQSGFLNELKPKADEKITANIADYLFHQELVKQGKSDEADAFANKAGLSKLDPQQQAQLQVETARLKEQDKEKAKRLSGFVNDGVGAADSVGNMRRAVQLLEKVKTGGFDNIAFQARRIFGVEGADEGELSNNLGKAVLSQLRQTFGAAFTAKEGEQLARIEGGFSKNTSTNKRLLNNAIKIATRAAKRGARAAKELGDDFSMNEIGLALDSAMDATIDFNQQEEKEKQETGFQILSIE